MSTLSQFGGNSPTTSIVNFYSSGGVKSASDISADSGNSMKEVLSGALTANTLSTILSATGGGEILALKAYAKDTTSRTVRLKVTIDGTSVFDATSSAITNTGVGIIAVGDEAGSIGGGARFNSSLTVEIASSLSETDKVAIGYILDKR